MGKLKVVETGLMSTIQDMGRFGYRKYGIPQSGAMDTEMMKTANHMIGNSEDFPVIEFAIIGMKLQVLEKANIAVVGASIKINEEPQLSSSAILNKEDILEVSKPYYVYAYLAISGKIQAKEDFGSTSTYIPASLGGIDGTALKKGDIIIINSSKSKVQQVKPPTIYRKHSAIIRIMKGPEWNVLKESPYSKDFQVHPSSNRIGIRFTRAKLENTGTEIASSGVIPGIIQLPSNGQPIILMNDCQTIGGYPRIGKVIDKDMDKLTQIRSGETLTFKPV